jgi:diguanylate cyclase (GGDEF)-like protein
MALMFMDIDKFKSINDGFGHAIGDAVLKEFARRLVDSVRQTDTVARLAGDEFVVILEGLHSAEEPQFVARKILAQMARPFDLDGLELAVTTSVGIAFHDAEGAMTTPSKLLVRADQALYASK